MHTTHFFDQYFDKKTIRLKVFFSSKYCSDISYCYQTGINRTKLYKKNIFNSDKKKIILVEKCHFIFLSQYCVPRCLVCLGPKCHEKVVQVIHMYHLQA